MMNAAAFAFAGLLCTSAGQSPTTIARMYDGKTETFDTIVPASGGTAFMLALDMSTKERPRFVTKIGVRCYLVIDPKDLAPRKGKP